MTLRRLGVLVCALACTSCITFPQNPKGPARCGNTPLAPPGLIAWWPLETFAGDPALINTYDTPDVVSGLTARNAVNDAGSNAGIAPPFQVPGHTGTGAHYQFHGRIGDVGYAYYFDPQGKTDFGTTRDFTLDAWAKPGCSGGPPAQRAVRPLPNLPPPSCTPYPSVIVKKLSLSAGYSFYLDAGGHLALDMKGPGGTAHFVTQARFAGSGWNFVSVRVPRAPDAASGNVVQMWMNGGVQALDTVNGDQPAKNTAGFDVSNGEVGTFGGGDIVLDEVEIFGRALVFWETLDIVNRGKCPPLPLPHKIEDSNPKTPG